MKYATTFREEVRGKEWLGDLGVSFLASILVALSGIISLKWPFTPVPVTLQVHVILFLSFLLGTRRASLMVLWYLMQGVMGYPVFALGGSGIATLMGPTGGYLAGYLGSSFLVGYLSEKMEEKSGMAAFLSMGAGNLLIYLTGFLWLSLFIGMKNAALFGVLPFIITDVIKLIGFAKLRQFLSFRRG